LSREPIDYARAVAQHAQYEAALRRLGCRVQRLPDAPDLPDSVFVEDTAVVFDDMAVIARPGAASRRAEVEALIAALGPHRRLACIEAPGTLDGGDVLVTSFPQRAGRRVGGASFPQRAGRRVGGASFPQRAGTRVGGPSGRVFVGISGRTNTEGARQLASLIAPSGLEVVPVPVSGCLHLKSAVTLARLRQGYGEAGGRTTLVINPEWVDVSLFDGFELIEVDPSEPAAANVLRIGTHVICAEEHPRTRARLEARGLVTQSVPAGELAKAEGGVTCCSVLVPVSSMQ
jgi:dimethylargininase